jgi:hypothetical protein
MRVISRLGSCRFRCQYGFEMRGVPRNHGRGARATLGGTNIVVWLNSPSTPTANIMRFTDGAPAWYDRHPSRGASQCELTAMLEVRSPIGAS